MKGIFEEEIYKPMNRIGSKSKVGYHIQIKGDNVWQGWKAQSYPSPVKAYNEALKFGMQVTDYGRTWRVSNL